VCSPSSYQEETLLLGGALYSGRMKHHLSDESDDTCDEYRDLEIDLDYQPIRLELREQIEPLDLSMKSLKHDFVNSKPKLPQVDIKPNFNFALFDEKIEEKIPQSKDSKGTIITEKELASLLAPYVKTKLKRFCCTICDIKFVSSEKAVTHVENKHVSCLQYKCPLCRASKGTRLAYESHLRRGHGARVQDYKPVIRCKKGFSVCDESQISKEESQSVEQYDLQFVTFLRAALEDEGSYAEWVDHEQGIFRINNRHSCARMWYRFKESEGGTWSDLYKTVIKEFIERNIFKELPGGDNNLVFQVFCIKQLLQ